MKALFKAVRDTIATKVTVIKWVDYDLGQLDADPPPVSWPCALFSFTSGDYTNVSPTNTEGVVQIEVAIGFRLRERTHSKADPTFSDQALEHIDAVEEVRIALTGLSGTSFATLQYRGFQKDKRSDYRVWRLRFECTDFPTPPESPYQPWQGAGPDFCVHPDIVQ